MSKAEYQKEARPKGRRKTHKFVRPTVTSFKPEGSSDVVIDQRRMVKLEEAEDLYTVAKNNYEKVYYELFGEVAKGAQIRPGKLYIKRTTSTRIVPKYKSWTHKLAERLGHDGDDYIKNTVRANTEAKTHFRIRIVHAKLVRSNGEQE